MNSYPPSIGGPPPQGGDQGYTNVQQDPWRHYSQSKSQMPMTTQNYEYNRGQRDNYTQSAAVPDNAFSNQQANNAINNTRKRAAKRRVKHDLPGPAGSWFRKNSKRPPKKAKALLLSTKKGIIKSEEQDNIDNGGEHVNNQKGSSSTNVDASQQQQQQQYTTSDVKSPDKVKSDPDNTQNKKQQQEQLFHDHSSDLHESSSWNIMCSTLNRIVPPSNLLLSSTQNISATYKHILRKHVSNEYALISEIHEGKYDTNHIGCAVGQNEGDVGLYAHDLRLPTVVGYIASVQCHAHSDWTALLVDEMQSVGSGGSSSSNNGKGEITNGIGKGVMCWVEEKLVKQHGGWIRPGVVWMIEGAKLALFNSTCEEDDIEEDDDDDTGINGNSLGTDISPSTDHVRGGGNINRMILVGESSLVYAWTPEEAATTFSHDEFISLTEKRLNLGLPGVIDNVIDVDKAHDVKPVMKPSVDQNPSLEMANVNMASSKPIDVIDIDKEDEEIAGKKKSEDIVDKTPGVCSITKSQTPLSVSTARKDPKAAAVDSLGNEDIIETISPNHHSVSTQSGLIIPQVTAATLTEQVTQNIQHSPATDREGGVIELETEGEETRKQPIVAKQDESRSTLEVGPSHDLDALSNKVNVNGVESNSKAVESPKAQSVKKVNPKTSDNDPLGLSKFKATAKPPPSQHAASNQIFSTTTQTHDKSLQQQAKATNPYAKENDKANGTSISNEPQRPIQSTETLEEDNKTKTDKDEPMVNKPESTPPRQVPPDQVRKATSNKPHTSSGLTPSQSNRESSSSDKGPSTNNVKRNGSFDEEISEDMVATKISHLTPKELIKRQSPKYTGDSFDDMLDEDDEEIFVDLATGSILDKSDVNLADTEVSVAKSNGINTSNPVVSTTQPPSSSPFALSSLDDEDLDMLDED